MSIMQYGLLGGKLGHSLSPKIHELFFKYTGINGSYELLETELEALPARVEAMRSTFAGSNVTILDFHKSPSNIFSILFLILSILLLHFYPFLCDSNRICRSANSNLISNAP